MRGRNVTAVDAPARPDGPADFAGVDRILRLAQKGGVFPGAVLLVNRRGRRAFLGACGYADLTTGERVTPDTAFDLASLTKPLATTLAAMALTASGNLSPEDPLGAHLPGLEDKAVGSVALADFLTHRSGLPDYRPYYRRLESLPFGERRRALRRWIADEPLEAAPGERTLYSDLGFLLLQGAVEAAAGMPLSVLFDSAVRRPLGVDSLFFASDRSAMARHPVAATERCPWRGRLIRGEVHDENAHCLGGEAGHAGLFGTAGAVEALLVALRSAWGGGGGKGAFSPPVVRRFLARPGDGGRPMGFDAPTPGASSSGRFFPFRSVGHLGFTGTSFWMDLERQIIVVLLTNRVHPSRRNERIRAFRPLLHDAVMAALLGG